MTVLFPGTNNTTSHSFFVQHKYAIALSLCWIVVQSALFYQHGIGTELEAGKYIFEANHLLENGTLSTPNFWLYSVQIFLISLSIKLNTGFFSVYIIQLLVNALATHVFFKFVQSISNRATAFVLALFLIFNIPIQTFNSFLQTESLFYSFTILFSCYILSLKKLSFKSLSFVFAFIILISFTRPTGLLFTGCGFLYLFFSFARSLSIPVRIGITIIACTGFLFMLNAALGSGGELDFMLPFRDERIICGVPTLDYFRDIKVSGNPNSVFGLLYYITHNFEQFIRLAWWRTLAFFGLARSYYSDGHNLYLYLYFFPFYLMGIAGILKWARRNKYLLLYCLALIIVTWLTVILTCDDWHNRFFLSVVPYIYILSAPVVQTITDKFKANDHKRNIQT